MDNLEHQDWSLIQSFLGVAETGSLSAAARQLGQSQPTLGRHIETLERKLGATLFERHARGLHLTDTGAHMVPLAEQMREAMQLIALTAAGQSQKLAGTVRITASMVASQFVLPPILADLRMSEPDIQIDLMPSDETENLLFRKADIAVRMYKPTQPDLIASHIGEATIRPFAASTYLQKRGHPRTLEDLYTHDVIGFDQNPLILDVMADLGHPADRDFFAIRCDNQVTYWGLVQAGCGIGFMQRAVGLNTPGVDEIDLDIAIPGLPIWLAAHPSMRHTPHVRRVWDALAKGLRRVAL